jgi:hypothetical protein
MKTTKKVVVPCKGKPTEVDAVKTVPPRNMGIGELGSSDITFARKFRWTLFGDHLNEMVTKKISEIDFIKKTMSFELYKLYDSKHIGKNPAAIWVDAMIEGEWPTETLWLTTFDGCGDKLDTIRFEGLTILEAKSDFDYESSDISTIRVVVGFRSYSRKPPAGVWTPSATPK